MPIPIAISSGEQNNNAIIFDKPCALACVSVHTDGANNCTVTVYDSATAANNGKKLGSWLIVGNQQYGGRNYDFPVYAANGLYAEVSGGGTYFIDFIDRDIRG